MKLHLLPQTVLRVIEPLPIASYDPATASLVERTQIMLSQAVTGVLRLFRSDAPIIWDPWILKDGETYRLFYLRAAQRHNPWWTVSHICGAISPDLHQWQDLGVLLEANPDNDWESGRVCAGCTYKEDGVYYLFYSAGGKVLPHLRNEAIGLAISSDGVNFSRFGDRPLLMPDADNPWYGRSSWTEHFHWRDPYLYKDEETGKYYLFICASSKVPGKFQGCVGLAVADRITGPYEYLPPVIDVPTQKAEDWPYYHLERPQVIFRDGKYHLFFSCFKQFFNPKWLHQLDRRRVTNSSLYWYVSDRLTGPFEPVTWENCIVTGSESTGMYGINFLEISQEPEEMIAYGWYHRLHTLEVSPRFRVDWQKREIASPSDVKAALKILPFKSSKFDRISINRKQSLS